VRTPDFDELVGGERPADDRERERLRRVHDLLLEAGPPAELSPEVEAGPDLTIPFRVRRSRRRTWRRATALLAAALAGLAVFFGGYLVGNRGSGFDAAFVVQMRGTGEAPKASASLAVARPDAVGNWPMRVTVVGLPELPRGGYYVLYLTRNGRPIAPCGIFRTQGPATSFRANAPYRRGEIDGWIVTRQGPGQRGPGPTVLRTKRV
jgi:hypothetical protein